MVDIYSSDLIFNSMFDCSIWSILGWINDVTWFNRASKIQSRLVQNLQSKTL